MKKLSYNVIYICWLDKLCVRYKVRPFSNLLFTKQTKLIAFLRSFLFFQMIFKDGCVAAGCCKAAASLHKSKQCGSPSPFYAPLPSTPAIHPLPPRTSTANSFWNESTSIVVITIFSKSWRLVLHFSYIYWSMTEIFKHRNDAGKKNIYSSWNLRAAWSLTWGASAHLQSYLHTFCND